MKKKTLFFILPLFFALHTEAQQNTAGNKPTTLAERVIGIIKVAGVDTGGFVDTFSFSYSANRGSAFDFSNMQYDFLYYFHPDNDSAYLLVKADTIKKWRVSYSGIDHFFYFHSFAPDNTVISRAWQESPGTDGQGYLFYNAQGLLIKTIELAPNNGTWDTSGISLLTYDSQNNLIADTLYSYPPNHPDYTYNYSYNANNQTTKVVWKNFIWSAGWKTLLTMDYTYYSNGKLASSISYTGDTLGLQKADSFEYNGTTDFATTQIERWYNPAFAMWIGGTKTVKHLNSNNLPDTVYEMEMNYTYTKWDTISKTAYTYTAYNNPQNAYTYGKNSNGYDSLLYSTRYYYELYNPTAVSDLPPSLEKMVLYPNPATNEINITWKNANGKRNFIEITDAAGRKRLTQSLIWNEPNQKVSISHLTTGIYYLTVRTAGGVLIYRQTIVKD